MLLALERHTFNYLYKYNQIKVDPQRLLHIAIPETTESLAHSFNDLVDKLDEILPIFEQDHEILLLELANNVHEHEMIVFNNIKSIYPLTDLGSRLLEGKLNADFVINKPIFENAIEKVKEKRLMCNAEAATNALCNIFSIDFSKNNAIYIRISKTFQEVITRDEGAQKTYLNNLFTYNKTPGYIPSGNIEFLCKIAAIATHMLGLQDEALINTAFYKHCILLISEINTGDIHESFNTFLSIKDPSFKEAYEKLLAATSMTMEDPSLFKISYYFLAFRSRLNKKEFNVEVIKDDVITLIENDKNTATWVLYLLGYVFSFEHLYESIHRMNHAPLFEKSTTKTHPHAGGLDHPVANEVKEQKLADHTLLNKSSPEREITDIQAFIKKFKIASSRNFWLNFIKAHFKDRRTITWDELQFALMRAAKKYKGSKPKSMDPDIVNQIQLFFIKNE